LKVFFVILAALLMGVMMRPKIIQSDVMNDCKKVCGNIEHDLLRVEKTGFISFDCVCKRKQVQVKIPRRS
jgi:hypothetical protein